MLPRLTDHQEALLKALTDPDEACAYLNAAILDENPKVFLSALKDVIKAQDPDMSNIAKKAGLNRESLRRMLSLRGNPEITSIIAILKAAGLHLVVSRINQK